MADCQEVRLGTGCWVLVAGCWVLGRTYTEKHREPQSYRETLRYMVDFKPPLGSLGVKAGAGYLMLGAGKNLHRETKSSIEFTEKLCAIHLILSPPWGVWG
jgi:hypothetical protein